MNKSFKKIECSIHVGRITILPVVIISIIIVVFSLFLERQCFSYDLMSHYKWEAVYRNSIELFRNSQPFSWNAALEDSSFSDEIVLMAKKKNIKPFSMFLKCSTGRKDDAALDYKNMFYIKQGHLGLDLFKEKFYLKAYIRERVYRSSMLLLPVVSSDSPYLNGNAFGVIAGIDNGRWFDISYTAARVSETKPEYSNGGLPDFNDQAGSFRLLTANLKWRRRGRLGMYLSETQSVQTGDGAAFGFTGGIDIFGIRLLTEFTERINALLKDLNGNSLNGFDFKEFAEEGISGVFPDNSAFSMEAQGASLNDPVLGSFLFIPGYRYYGADYSNSEGEIRNSLVESYMLSQWRHSKLALAFKVKGGNVYSYDSDNEYKYIRNTLRMRFKTGVTLKGGFISRERMRTSYFVTVEDDNKFSRLLTTLRVDDCRGEDKISYLSDGWVNISDLWMLRGSLYLYRSTESRYSISLEYRPSRRFLFTASFGSFNPYLSAVAITQDWEPGLAEKNRRISFYTRIWFGGIRD